MNMLLVIPFPNIDPVYLRIPSPFGEIELRWYGLMYMIAFVIGFFLLQRYAKFKKLDLTKDDVYDLLFYMILGVMVGGRLGYVILYDLPSYLSDPLSILTIWRGGMSFHGGFVGMLLAALLACRRRGWNFWQIADLVSAAAPVGLGLGRIGNFINGELFGRTTDVAWGMVFPEGGEMPRHPSQLYEAFFEGLVLFVVLRWLYRKGFASGTVFWGLVGFYGLFRTFLEMFREPDAHIGFDLGPLTRGQLLSLPMLVVGMAMLFIYVRQRRPPESSRPSKSRAR